MRPAVFLFCLFLLFSTSVLAGEADVVDVAVRDTGGNTYQFDVTVVHADEGWEHYADGGEVVAPDGTVLATRRLAHPHVTEQPFTRRLSGVMVPEGISRVSVRAHDSVHGNGGQEMSVELPR
jgi:hypothetical protein